MKVYVNSEHHICAVHTTRDQNLILLEIPDNTFPENATDDLIKCYSCWGDENGNYIIQLLVSPDMADQINQTGLQRLVDQETIKELQNTDNSIAEYQMDLDYRLSCQELGI